jgi:cytochrome b involved in lipid metabolism
MGWLQISRKSPVAPKRADDIYSTIKKGIASIHIEHAESVPRSSKATLPSEPRPQYPLQPENVPDEDLPFIPAKEVACRRCPGLTVTRDEDFHHTDLWIVVDHIVYDCSGFIDDHPGGRQVIVSFVGEDCSWQFWRFHNKEIMQQYGRPLRIGRTQDVKNRFIEPKRYVGLRPLGTDW